MYKHPLYPHLFSPLKVNRLVLKNRIFYAPVEYYHDRALSGCAVMMRGTSGTLNDPRCRINPGKWLFADSELPRVTRELSVLKRNGALTSLEIMHAGICAQVEEGDYCIGPSDGVREDGVKIRGMDQTMMDRIIDEFVETALIAKKIGYDMIMMHYAHGWLPSQFFAPVINRRTDEYGGCYENRVRFPKMILRAVRNALGKDYPIDMRISAFEDFDGCMPAEEVIRFIKEVSEEGLIDLVNVSYGGHFSLRSESKTAPSAFSPDMCYADHAAEIKRNVSIPVVVVGKIMTPEEAEEIIREGKADAVVIGRASIADPWWAKKAFECRAEDIVPCISCGKCFSKRCSVNIRGYMEDMVPSKLTRSGTPGNVVIVGGGPAGMKAALTAAERGHKVSLYEASGALGGLLKAADHDENKRELKRYKDYLICQIEKSPVTVHLNHKPERQELEAEHPDHLVLAMGSVPVTPPVPGVEHAIQALDAHEHPEKIGKKVIMIGGGLVGSEFALTLALRGHHVTVVELTDVIGGRNDSTTFRPYDMMRHMENIIMLPNTQCQQIRGDGVVVKEETGQLREISADTVILSTGFRSNRENMEAFYGIAPNTIMIGDLRRPATVRECEEEGYFAFAEI